MLRHKLIGIAVLACFSAIAADHDQLVTPIFQPESIMFEPNVSASQFTLRVSGPDDLFFEIDFESGEMPFLEVAYEALPDGQYTFELVATPQALKKESTVSAEMRGLTAERTPRGSMNYSGYFSVKNGSLVMPTDEPHYSVGDREIRSKNDEEGSGEQPVDFDVTPRDQVILDDLIVDGSACIGFDCVNGESFGFDTIRLKENNLRIKFMDTSTGSFPSTDWQLTANDSASGGANKFSIDDITGNRTPFTVEGNAPSHSLYVDDGGRVGFGTSTPSVELHVIDGDTPTLRLQQDGSSGFQPQIWDLAGNETSFFIRDASNGSTLPFRIRPSAPSNALVIDTDGDVAVGTLTADASLHVTDTAGQTTLQLEQTNGTVADRQMIHLQNNGGSRIDFENTDNNVTWRVATEDSDDDFIITRVGSGALELQLTQNGDLTVTGMVTGSSSRTVKENITPVDPNQLLAAVESLPIAYWNYTADKKGSTHVGPMAEDFWDTFGVGINNKTIAPADMSGIALASIKALKSKIDEKDATIAELQKRLEAIEAALAQ